MYLDNPVLAVLQQHGLPDKLKIPRPTASQISTGSITYSLYLAVLF